MAHDFSIVESLEFGWHKTRAHSALVFQVILSLFALQVASTIVGKVLGNSILGILASIGITALSVYIGAGATLIVLRLAAGHGAHLTDLLPPGRLVWKFFCASFVSGFAVVLGLLLFVVPGIILLVRLSMVRFAVVDGAGIEGSINRSWQETRGHFWHIFGFLLALVGINIIGAMLFFVGLLITLPVSALAYAHVYLKLKKAP